MNGQSEVPPNGSAALAGGIAAFDGWSNTITVSLSFSGLTAPATASHIHVGGPGTNGDIIVSLLPFTPSATSGNINTTNLPFPAANIQDLNTDNIYIDIHDAVFPGGEIRGQLVFVNIYAWAALYLATNGLGDVVRNPFGNGLSYPTGTVVAVTATPAPGWGFQSWSGDASGTNNPLSVVVMRDTSITANFLPAYNLTLSNNGLGSVAVSPELPTYLSNAVVSMTATPGPGWTFQGWSVDASGSINPTNIVMNTNKFITANFMLLPTLAATPTAGGTIIVTPNAPFYNFGDTVALTALPDLGWQFTGWTGDAAGAVNPLSLVMSTNKNVTANFVSAVSDVIVDNNNSNNGNQNTATFTGIWTNDSGSVGTGWYDSDYRYAPTFASGSNTNATFTPNLPMSGNYDVYVWYPGFNQASKRCSDAHYSWFIPAIGNQLVSMDQRSGGNSWNLLVAGTKWPQGTNGYVRLSNQSSDTGRYVAADAVRWVWSSNQVTQPYITSVARAGSAVTLSWLAGSNYTYQLEYKTNLNESTWHPLTPTVLANGNTATNVDTTPGSDTARFYRVKLLP